MPRSISLTMSLCMAALLGGCQLDTGWSIHPCGANCATNPDAVKADDDKTWGTYKGVFVDSERTAAFTIAFSPEFVESTTACRVRFGEETLDAPATQFDKGRMEFRFATVAKPGCVSPDCSSVAVDCKIEAVGKSSGMDAFVKACRKETSSSQIKVYEGTYLRAGSSARDGFCGLVVQGDRISGGCSQAINGGQYNVFEAKLTSGKFTVDVMPPTGPTKVMHWEGTLAADGASVDGTWRSDSGSGTFRVDRTK